MYIASPATLFYPNHPHSKAAVGVRMAVHIISPDPAGYVKTCGLGAAIGRVGSERPEEHRRN